MVNTRQDGGSWLSRLNFMLAWFGLVLLRVVNVENKKTVAWKCMRLTTYLSMRRKIHEIQTRLRPAVRKKYAHGGRER